MQSKLKTEMEMKLKDSKLTELQKKYDDLEAGSMNK